MKAILLGLVLVSPVFAGEMERNFASPPDAARPWVWAHWLDGNVSKQSITTDLEAMKRVGLGGLCMFDVGQGTPPGPLTYLDKGWREAFAHYSFGAVYQWMVENIAGIRNAGDAYRQIVIAPQLDQKLTWAKTRYDSVRGAILSEWKRDGQNTSFHVKIPANTTATVELPSGKRHTVGSGSHTFEEKL